MNTQASEPAEEHDRESRTRASKETSPGPRLPHERDESDDSQARLPEAQADIGERAFEDAQSDREDTSKAKETDAAYGGQRRQAGGP